MKVFVKGDGEVSLSTRDFVAEGGEGKVFAKGTTGYKIYHDAAKAIPTGKMNELAQIADANVICPLKPIFSGKTSATHVGHTFRFVSDTWTLCQLFPRAFREREGLTHELALKLVRKMQDGVDAVHKAGILLVDLNEMNFLVSRDFATPFFIDVDSYQTQHYPATAIMPSVRDWQVQGTDFNEGSDWFSFAIVTFQMLVGIHPYKGKHPTLKGLEERMRGNVSVFSSEVSVPKVCYPFDVIPEAYRQWYRAVFENGRREHPPIDLQGTIVVRPTIRVIASGDKLLIEEISAFGAEIRAVFHHHGKAVVHAGDTLYVDGRSAGTFSSPVRVAFTPRDNRPIVATVESGMLQLFDTVEKKPLPVTVRCDEVVNYDGRVYIRSRDKVCEVTFVEGVNHIGAGVTLAVNVLEHASRLFEGVVLQNLLGKPHASLLAKSGTVHQTYLPELEGHRVTQARLSRNVLMVMASDGTNYHRFVFRFDESFSSYDLRKVEDVDLADLDFVVLDSGVCVCLDEQERLEVFSSRKGSSNLKIVEDPALGGDMTLAHDSNRVLFHRGQKLYSMRLK